MTKQKEKTTALPAAKRLQAARRVRSRSERESEVNRLVAIFSAVLIILIVVIVGGALLIDNVFTPNQAVATVNGEGISSRYFQRRVKFEKWRSAAQVSAILNAFGSQAAQYLTNAQSPYAEIYNEVTTPTLLGQKVLDQMIQEKIVAQYAKANNITVSDDEINDEVYTYFRFDKNPVTETPTLTPTITLTPLVSATPSPTPTQTLTPTEQPQTNTPTVAPSTTPSPFPTGLPTATPGATERYDNFLKDSKDYYEAAVKAVGFTESELREIFRSQALRKKVLKVIAGDPPKEEEQVNARHILVKTQDEANNVLKALQNGESFASLAKAISTDTGSKDNGGELGWQGRGVYVKEFDDAVFSAEVGKVIGPIDTSKNGQQFGFHIIQVEAKEVRPLTDTEGTDRQTTAFNKWIKSETDAKATKDPIWLDRIPTDPTLAQLGIPSPSQLQGQ